DGVDDVGDRLLPPGRDFGVGRVAAGALQPAQPLAAGGEEDRLGPRLVEAEGGVVLRDEAREGVLGALVLGAVLRVLRGRRSLALRQLAQFAGQLLCRASFRHAPPRRCERTDDAARACSLPRPRRTPADTSGWGRYPTRRNGTDCTTR